MINLPQGFRVGNTDAIDSRLVLTKAEMKAANDNVMPQTYFAACKDDGKFYLYNKNNTIDSTIGKFRLFEGGNASEIEVDTISLAEIDSLFEESITEGEENNG